MGHNIGMNKKALRLLVQWVAIVWIIGLSGHVIAQPEETAETLVISDAWSPEAPPGRTMAGFMTIQNQGESAIALVDGYSPHFNRVEIHDMINDEGVMRMRRLESLVIEPASQINLQPGGFHIMLMEPKQTFSVGENIELVLTDRLGRDYAIVLTVRSR